MLLSDAHRARLLANGQRRAHDPAFDPVPVLKVYTPDARVVWLLAFLYPEDPGRAHALCDAGTGFPALIDIRIEELERLRGPRGVALAIDPSRSEEHTSELQSLMRISYAVFCLKKTSKPC